MMSLNDSFFLSFFFTFIAIEGFTSIFIKGLDEFNYNIRACNRALSHLRPLHYEMTKPHADHIVIVVLTSAEGHEQNHDAAYTASIIPPLRRKISPHSKSFLKAIRLERIRSWMSVASQCLYCQISISGTSGAMHHATAPAISYFSYSIAEAKSSARIHTENIESGP